MSQQMLCFVVTHIDVADSSLSNSQLRVKMTEPRDDPTTSSSADASAAAAALVGASAAG